METSAYGVTLFESAKALYPEGHPYRHHVIGLHEDLANASLEDVKNFFRKWYAPANATLVVAGDFENAVSNAARLRKPVRITRTSATSFTVTDRSSGAVIQRRELGADSEWKVTSLTFSPTTVDVFPAGITSASLTVICCAIFALNHLSCRIIAEQRSRNSFISPKPCDFSACSSFAGVSKRLKNCCMR